MLVATTRSPIPTAMIIPTDELHELFRAPQRFQGEFEDRLEQMLEHDRLGVFVLVLANACMDDVLFARLGKSSRVVLKR